MAGLVMALSADIRFACQTYSWQMSGERYRGRLDHIVPIAADAGFAGVEPEVFMLGDNREPWRLQQLLTGAGLELAAVALACEWRYSAETDEEKAEADEIIRLVGTFPGAKLVLVQLPGQDRSNLEVRQRHAISCMNTVARRALEAGVQPTVHPNSPPGSLFRISEDYKVLFDCLDYGIGFTADVGHVASGGMDPLDTVKRYRDRLDHIHFKDIHDGGSWAQTGYGRIDFPAIVECLADTGYEGWVVFEDESEEARQDPDAATRRNGTYAREVLAPILSARSATDRTSNE
jgi:inosose dehydratase